MRPVPLVTPDPGRPFRVPASTDAIVVGAGVAGFSAAVVLAERGVRVTLLEAAETVGGRLGAWPHRLPDGHEQIVEHGFHAFFRQYYTFRAVLRRIDPELSFLRPVGRYPVLASRWPEEDLGGLPSTPPLNVLALFARSPSLTPRDLLAANRRLGFELLGYHPERTARALDEVSAGAFLSALNLSDRARTMLFEAFARSFFCNEDDLSAAELLAMFHFYFLGNPEGLAFDAPVQDYRTAMWRPLTAYLAGHGATVRTGTRVLAVAPSTLGVAEHGWRVALADETVTARHVVLALDPGGLRAVLEKSADLRAVAPELARRVAALRLAKPFVVSRLWLDSDVRNRRAVFSAVTGEDTLDSVTCYHRLEEPSRRWADHTGGSILELHSYACPEPSAERATERMRAELARLWPETASARVTHQLIRREATAPAFPPGSLHLRPQVRTEARGLRIAGDFVQLPYLAGLMERSAMSGVLAANDILAEEGAAPEPIVGVPQRGLLAGLTPGTRRSRGGQLHL